MEDSSQEANSTVLPRDGGAGENTQVLQHLEMLTRCLLRQIPTPQSEENRSDHNTENDLEAGQPKTTPDLPDLTESKRGAVPWILGQSGLVPPLPPPDDYQYVPRRGRPAPPLATFGPPPSLMNTTAIRRAELKESHDEYILLLEDRITRLENS